MNAPLSLVSNIDQRAAAVADVHQMLSDLRNALDMIGQLKADLAREQDRTSMALHTSAKFEALYHRFRDECVKMAKTISDMGLLCNDAQMLVQHMSEMTTGDGERALAAIKQ